MHQFFVESTLTRDAVVHLPSELLRQIKTVLKLHPSEKIWLSDTQHIMEGEIQPDFSILLRREVAIKSTRTPITLYAALIRKERFEWMLQKATELGVDHIVPLIMERNVVKWDDEPRKLQRYASIVREAAEQCHRVDLPVLRAPIKLKALNQHLHAVALVAYEMTDQTQSLMSVSLKGSDIGILIGPEGGISEGELAFLREHGWTAVGLGPRTLRAETAALAALTLVNGRLDQ